MKSCCSTVCTPSHPTRLLLLAALLAASALAGCATPSRNVLTQSQGDPSPVRRLDFRSTPEMEDLALRARETANAIYPQVVTLLSTDPSESPDHFNIVFRKRLPTDMPGRTRGRTIQLDAGWLATHPFYLNAVLVHEMAHVAQNYRWPGRVPRHWAEGIADYVRFKLGYVDGRGAPSCTARTSHFTQGYRCAGTFLLHLEATHGPELVRDLNVALRRGTYSDSYFLRTTGQSLDELWSQFRTSTAFTAEAAVMEHLRGLLGDDGKASPGRVRSRFQEYLERQHSGADLEQIKRWLGWEGRRMPDDAMVRYASWIAEGSREGKLTEESGQALMRMIEACRVPGPPSDPQVEEWLTCHVPWFPPLGRASRDDWPASRLWYRNLARDPSLYCYLMVRRSDDSPWQLERVWRVGPDGRTVAEEHSVD